METLVSTVPAAQTIATRDFASVGAARLSATPSLGMTLAEVLAADSPILEAWRRRRVWGNWGNNWSEAAKGKPEGEREKYEDEAMACYDASSEYWSGIFDPEPAGPAGVIVALRVYCEDGAAERPVQNALVLLENLFPDVVAALDDLEALAATEAAMETEIEASASAAA